MLLTIYYIIIDLFFLSAIFLTNAYSYQFCLHLLYHFAYKEEVFTVNTNPVIA